jgi:hypothetical protein
MDAPVVVEVAPHRCPPPDPAAIAEFKRRTPPPAGAVTRAQAEAWLDAYELAEARKNAVGQRLVREYERCRGV